MLDEIGPGSLKLVVASDGVERILRGHVPDEHIRPVGRGAWIIFTETEVADVRDWFVAGLADAAQVFVVEFEHWSGHGAIDAAWLLRRGH